MGKLFNVNKKGTKKKKILITVGGLGIAALVVGGVMLATGEKAEYTYKETEVEFGNLVVGVTESGTVDIGTVEQTFDLDMSALQRVSTSASSSSSSSQNNSSGGAMGGFYVGGFAGGDSVGEAAVGGTAQGGGLNMFSQIFGMSGGNTAAQGTDSSLTISNVLVSVGQQVSQGDVLFELEEESVAELEEQLQSNIEKAKADLDAVYADQKLSKQTAEYTYKTSTAYGTYAQTEYDTTVWELQQTVEEKEQALEQAKESLSGYQEQLTAITKSYEEAALILENCNWSLENTDKASDVLGYTYYFELAQSAESNVDSLKQKKEQLTRNVEQAEENVETAQKSYNSAKRSLAQGLISAQQTLDLRNLAYNTAQETYDIAMAYLEEDSSEQEEIYQEVQDKWEEFSSHISGNNVCAQYNGVITSVELAAGDSIYTGDVLVSLYNMDEVSMTVTVDEDDMTDISVGSQANISFTAYPNTTFTARVSEIADAVASSDGSVTYDVTVTLQGDVSGLFQGMTGDITFVTEETKDVLYVSKRAIITDNDKSYVKIRNEKGDIEKKEVVTGFTDGINIEIVEGLSEGDVVLIESKVGA